MGRATPICGARSSDGERVHTCSLPAGHNGGHQATAPGFVYAWPRTITDEKVRVIPRV